MWKVGVEGGDNVFVVGACGIGWGRWGVIRGRRGWARGELYWRRGAGLWGRGVAMLLFPGLAGWYVSVGFVSKEAMARDRQVGELLVLWG